MTRGLFFNAKKGLSRDVIAWLNQPVDFSVGGIFNWLKQKSEKAVVDNHRLSMHCFLVKFDNKTVLFETNTICPAGICY